MKLCASVVSRAALVLLAVVTASVGSSEDTSEGNPWIPVDRPNSKKLSNVDDNAVSGIKQVVVNGNYYQRLDKDDTPGINKQPPLLLGRHVYKTFEDDIKHHGIVVDSAFEKDSMITIFQVKYDDGQTEDLYLDEVLPWRQLANDYAYDAKQDFIHQSGATAVAPALLHNKEHISGGGSMNVNVDVNVGLLQTAEITNPTTINTSGLLTLLPSMTTSTLQNINNNVNVWHYVLVIRDVNCAALETCQTLINFFIEIAKQVASNDITEAGEDAVHFYTLDCNKLLLLEDSDNSDGGGDKYFIEPFFWEICTTLLPPSEVEIVIRKTFGGIGSWSLYNGRRSLDGILDAVKHSIETTKRRRSDKRMKPWESTPPKSIALMHLSTTQANPGVLQRHQCLKAVRKKHLHTFKTLIRTETTSTNNPTVVLIDPSYHPNVGDHMLTLGELKLLENISQLQFPTIQCHYSQAQSFVPGCNEILDHIGREFKTHKKKIALWHAGGNWGDLWSEVQDYRIPSFKTILNHGFDILSLPQSLFYEDESVQEKEAVLIKKNIALGLGLANTSQLDTADGQKLAHTKVTFTWREKESLDLAKRLYPFVQNLLVPDMAWQLGPFLPIRKSPEKLVDILVFLRYDKHCASFHVFSWPIHSSPSILLLLLLLFIAQNRRDKESKVNWSNVYIQSIMPNKDLTYRIVDWSDRLGIFGTTDYFFTETAIKQISLGKVVVCDRLHAAILAYLTGIPFVYIDQVSGKISKTFHGSFDQLDDCLDGDKGWWAKALSLPQALSLAHKFILLLDEDEEKYV